MLSMGQSLSEHGPLDCRVTRSPSPGRTSMRTPTGNRTTPGLECPDGLQGSPGSFGNRTNDHSFCPSARARRLSQSTSDWRDQLRHSVSHFVHQISHYRHWLASEEGGELPGRRRFLFCHQPKTEEPL